LETGDWWETRNKGNRKLTVTKAKSIREKLNAQIVTELPLSEKAWPHDVMDGTMVEVQEVNEETGEAL